MVVLYKFHCIACISNVLSKVKHTVESRYLKLGYFEFCEVQSVFLNQKYILMAFSNNKLAFANFFYKLQLPEVQINLHFG